jgi:Leucine-rich repeat (LRR) protein
MLQKSEFEYLKNEILSGEKSRILAAISLGRDAELPIDAFYTDILSICNFLEAHTKKLYSLPQLRDRLKTEGLNLSALGLNHLPKCFEVLADLTDKVDLSRNDFSEMPTLLLKFKRLRELNLSGNLLRKLPLEFENFKQLELLDLSNNIMMQLPEPISKFQNLKILKLSCNNNNYFSNKTLPKTECLHINYLRTMPLSDLVLEMHTLKKLYLEGIAELPANISKLKNLEELYIERSGIEDLPDELSEISSLKILSLCNLQLLNRLPEVVFKLENLEMLDLAQSPIRELPARLRLMKKLKKINILGCADEKTLEIWRKRCESWGMVVR